MSMRTISSSFGMRLLGIALATSIVAPGLAYARQSPPLAEVAKKEAERRKTVKESGKTLTTKDLPESARKPAAAPAANGTAGATAPQAAGDTKPAATAAAQGDGKHDEAYWRNKLKQAQDGLTRSETFADALQSRINGLTTDFSARDDPYQRAKIGEDRQKAIAELEKVKGEILTFRKQLDDIQEEARKAGVPPGWLR